jgi:hypothetical protein
MSETKTITINGRQYDAHSGLVVDTTIVQSRPATSTAVPVAASVSAAHVHSSTQRSHTLNRKALKRPQLTKQLTGTEIILNKKPQTQAHRPTPVANNQHITKFAPHPQTVKVNTATPQRTMDIGPVTHPHVAKAHAISKAKAESHLSESSSQQSAQQIKQVAINTAIANTSSHTGSTKKHLLKRQPRRFSIVSASIALILLGGYLTYLNMPSLSVRVAAAQAGINASYPNYQPDGYSLNGMIGYTQGKVSMKFAANGGPQQFTINQTKSSWDSTAVLDNYVTPKAGVSYIPYTERGLTIYTYGNNAAWVNGGILYTIEGNAPLSSEQIRRIATSLI